MNDRLMKRKEFARFFAVNACIAMFAFSVLMIHELTNTYDGLWHGPAFEDYAWTLSTGRWFWPVLGKIRLSMSPEPFTTAFSVLMYVLGSCVAVRQFEEGNSFKAYAAVQTSVITTAVCAALSYRFQSPTFAASYLLSVTAVCLIMTPSWKRFAASVVLLTLSLASYQANLGCACVLILARVLWLLQNENSIKAVFRFFAFACLSVLFAGILYKLAWDGILLLTHVRVAAYAGADDVSFLKIIRDLPQSLIKTYQSFGSYFFTDWIKHHAFQNHILYTVLYAGLILSACISMGIGMMAQDRRGVRIALAALCLVLFPPAANVALILASGTGTSIQMTMPMSVIAPFLICAAGTDLSGQFGKVLKTACAVALSTVLVGNALCVSVDQHEMLAGRRTTVSILQHVAQDVYRNGGPDGKLVFVGKVSDSLVFLKDALWDRANGYAQYGNIWISGDCNVQSYRGLLREAGLELNLNRDFDKWHELEKREEVKEMPAFPYDGYIREIDGCVVIKMSD